MALTDKSQLMGRFQESAFNTILKEVMLQNPKTFNYATTKVINTNRYCTPIAIDPTLNAMGVEKCTEVPKLPIIGSTDSNLGVDYCAQIKDLKVDFNPSSSIQLPPELGSLAVQQFALKGTICAGLGCNQISITDWKDRDIFIADTRRMSRKLLSKKAIAEKIRIKEIKKGLVFTPAHFLKMNCFCLSLYAKVVLLRSGNQLKLKLVGIELEDMAPLGLENSIECYLKQMLDNVVFPKLKIAVDDLVFNAGNYFSVSLAPVSSALPHNPDISNNYLSIFLNLN